LANPEKRESAPALVVQGLHAHYGPSHILHGVNLTVPAGAIVGLVGRNGVGKTTTVNTIMAIVRASEGSIEALGVDITHWPTHRIARAGVRVVPQGRRLFPSVTVREHLAIAVQGSSGGRTIDWVYERFPALKERAAAAAKTLSGGEQSQLAIARAVIAGPELILMDEPTEGLAPLMVAEVGRLIALLREEGTSVLLVEQNLKFALDACDELAIMSRGEIIRQERVAEIKDRGHFIDSFMGVQVGHD